MIQVRHGVFETNSSSTHSIAVPKVASVPKRLTFRVGEFGWEFDSVSPTDYFYTALYAIATDRADAEDKVERLRSILESNNIEYDFGEVSGQTYSDEQFGSWFSLSYGYIDHGGELADFVEELLNDEDKLLRFLSAGLVFTGNDNSSTEQRCFINRDRKVLTSYDWRNNKDIQIENPYYMEDHEDYDWYYKGN